MKNYGSKKAQKNGAFFEKLIEAACRYYKMQGMAHIEKTPEPFQIQKKDQRTGRVTGFYKKKAQPDFSGTLKGGKSVVFEAKHTDGTNMPFSRVNAQQVADLDAHDKLGAISFIIISFGTKKFYRVPIHFWINCNQRVDKKSLNENDLKNFEFKFKDGRLQFLEREV